MAVYKYFQTYRVTNRPYQSLPQMVLAMIIALVAVAGMVTMNPIWLAPGGLCVVALELSAFPQSKYWRAKTKQE